MLRFGAVPTENEHVAVLISTYPIKAPEKLKGTDASN